MNRRGVLAALIFIALLLLSALFWRLLVPAPQGGLRLTRAHFPDLAGWATNDPRGALLAFQRSCTVLAAMPPSTAMGGYAGTAGDWRGVCAAAKAADANAARDFFEQWFEPLLISSNAGSDGLFTGYYEPELHGSIARHGRYQTPVYGVPSDLVTVDLGSFRASLKGEHISGRVDRHRLIPYPSRAEIDDGGLPQAPVLFYADDPVAVFFLHIQGSGRVVFDDGTRERVAYAGENGRPYTPIGRTLIDKYGLAKDKMSLQAIRAWMHAHPGKARDVMESDESYIFFELLALGDPALGATGAEGVALMPEASIAVDPRLHPLGAPFFLATTAPDGGKLERLFIAQDVGGAIRGAVRADIFFGFGQRAERLAGGMKGHGQMYVLLPKQVAQHLK